MSSIFGSLIGAAANIGSTVINNNMARDNYALAAHQNYLYGEMAASNAYLRQMSYYNNFLSPSAQVEQLKKAGLSPALMYSHGMSGSSGVSAPQGSGAVGNQPQTYPLDLMSNALIAAQIANVKADTEKKQAETGNISQQTFNLKTENDKLVTEIGNIAAQTENYKVQRRLYSLQSDFQEITNFYQKEFNDKNLHLLENQIDYLNEQTYSLILSNQITEQQKSQLVKSAFLQNCLVSSQIAVNKSQANLNDMQREQLHHSIIQAYQNIILKGLSVNNETERNAILKQQADQELIKINNEYELGLDKNAISSMSSSLYSMAPLFYISQALTKPLLTGDLPTADKIIQKSK